MAEENTSTEGQADEAGVKKAAKKKLFIIIGVVVLLIIIGAAAFLVLGKKKEEPAAETPAAEGEHKAEGEHAAPAEHAADPNDPNKKKLYLNIGEFLVNLNVTGKQPSFLKMMPTLEVVGEANKLAVEQNLPRIKDAFQTYLRELRADDLKGSAGVFRLREALLLRVNKVVAPAEVTDILFEELIVQ